MSHARRVLTISVFCVLANAAQTQQQTPTNSSPPTIASVLESQLQLLEGQFIPAAEAMPEDKYSFAPMSGNQKGVRTFALEIKHVATANAVLYSAILGQEPPRGARLAGTANGPDDLRSKEEILTYLKVSFALGRRALATLTAENATQPLVNSPIALMNSRLALATFSLAHSWDHYGQMVEYLRANGIIPPASQGQPLANPPLH